MKSADLLVLRQQNQHLLGTKVKTPEDVVRLFGAVQSQDYAGARWGICQRTIGTTSAGFDAAFAAGRILRVHILRPTWHFVLPEDVRWILALTAPRIKAVGRYYWRKLGLTDTVLANACAIAKDALAGGKQLTRIELRDILARAGIPVSEGRLGHLMEYAELEGVVCSGALRGKQHTYALLDERAPAKPPLAHNEALAALALRFFAGHGPATLHDFAWWSGLAKSDAAAGLESVKRQLQSVEVAGSEYWFAPSPAASSTPTVHLLPNYDEYIVGYTDRSMLFNPDHIRHLDIRQNPLFNHTVIIDGVIAGTWQPSGKKGGAPLTYKLFREPSSEEAASLEASIARYVMCKGANG